MFKTSSFITALGLAILMSGQAMAAPGFPWMKQAAPDHSPVQLAGSFSGNNGPIKKKICTNTYHAGGIRCTFCYYTTQPGSGSTVCIKLNTGNSSNSGPAKSFRN